MSLAILMGIALTAAIGPLFVQYHPNALGVGPLLASPSKQHWFGTDELGRDIFSRCLSGGRVSLEIAAGATLLGVVGGTIWGLLAAFFRGWIDDILMRCADAAMAVPELVLGLMFVAALGASVGNLILIIGLILIPVTARIMRSAALAEMSSDYYLAAVSAGASPLRILASEVFPNTAPVLLARGSVALASAVLAEATFSFLGLGVQPPAASWGTLVQQGYGVLYQSPTYFAFPGILILLTILASNTLGDQLQTILDPRAS